MLTSNTVLQGRYCILRQIGGGGQALVYLAEDLNLGIRRAVKELTYNPNATPQERQAAYDQFQREARILAGLNHPNLVRVWDHFRVGGNAYLVMDYIDGRTLQEVVDQASGFLPEAAVLRWAGQICNVLDYLHRQQPPIIFRDLKPSNVMLDLSDTIKLIDFGIARFFQPGKKTDTLRMGTEGYAPPEQYRGRGQTDGRSDIYSLGATLHHLLTKRDPTQNPPFSFDTAPPCSLNLAVSPHTEETIMKALAYDQADRFQSASEMHQALKGTATPSLSTPQGQTRAQAILSRFQHGTTIQVASLTIALIIAIGLVGFFVGREMGLSRGVTVTRTAPAIALVVTTPASTAAFTTAVPPIGTFTPRPTPSETPKPTWTPQPTYTPLPSYTPLPTLTRTPRPTLTMSPTLTPSPTPTLPTQAILQRLEDRFGMTFVYVPAGEFTMGSDSGDSNEQPVHTIDLNSFWIDKTEVTNAQYRSFVEAGGYQQQELWTQAGWDWRESNNIAQPSNWDDGDYNQPDQPVVGVSWYEAVAYTRWLARETGLKVRLPTEAEWEKAARGTDRRTYPWGNELPDGTRLNYCDQNCTRPWKDETVDDGYSTTAPVGSYPAGASPYGALDMAGNVWEWTSSQAENYPYQTDDGREEMGSSGRRVLRGGSWNLRPEVVRAANRYWHHPDDRLYNLGLRTVVVSR